MPVGLFGKYPRKRDFVAHNLPNQILRPLEDWLQAGVAASKQVLGSRWQDRFLVQPFWNFRLGSAIAGTDCLGTFMPSVDGVGRYFPLCAIGWPDTAEEGYPIAAIFEYEEWFAKIQARLLSTLDDGNSPGPHQITDGLAPPPAQLARKRGTLKISGEDFADTLLRGARISLYAAELAEDEMTVWWTGDSNTAAQQLIAAKGMPDPYAFAEMMGEFEIGGVPRPTRLPPP